MTAVSMVETTTYVSALGEAFKGNIANVRNQAMAQNMRTSDADIIKAVEEFVLAMADDILEMLAGAALSRTGQRQLRQATFTIYAVELGAFGFTIAILVLNVVALVILIVVAVKLKAWSRMSLFDITDPGGLSCAAFLGGTEKSQYAVLESFGTWSGDPRHRVFDAVSIRTQDEGQSSAPAAFLSTKCK